MIRSQLGTNDVQPGIMGRTTLSSERPIPNEYHGTPKWTDCSEHCLNLPARVATE